MLVHIVGAGLIVSAVLLSACQLQNQSVIHPAAKEEGPTAMTLPADQRPTDSATGSIFFIGDATVLICYAGFTILTDPTFIHKHGTVPLGYGVTATRLTDPAIAVQDLPPLDFILLSHFQGDHFDQEAERGLDKSIPIVTTLDAADELAERGFADIHPLNPWGTILIDKGDARLRLTAMPARYAPYPLQLALPDAMGSMLEFQSSRGTTAFTLYISGDTVAMDLLKEIPRRYPNIDLALLHLGGTRMLGFLVTMDGKQGVEAMRIVNPDRAIPIHYNDYDRFQSPLSEFQNEVQAAGLQDRVQYLDQGQTYQFHTTKNHLNRLTDGSPPRER